MSIYIIEPHGDDAFISCSSALMNPEKRKVLITLSGRDSNKLTSYYQNLMSYYCWIHDIHYDYRLKYNTHDIHRRYINKENLYLAYCEDMEKLLNTLASDSYQAFKSDANLLFGHFLQFMSESDLVLLPVGLLHPNHYATRVYIEYQLDSSIPFIYYVDKPYIEKRYVQEIFKSAGYTCFTARVQDKETRAKIYKEVYPTEQSLLRYSSKSILEWKDIYAIPARYEDHPSVKEFIHTVSDMTEGDIYENLICYAPEG